MMAEDFNNTHSSSYSIGINFMLKVTSILRINYHILIMETSSEATKETQSTYGWLASASEL